jgi:oligogalacturonide lyase
MEAARWSRRAFVSSFALLLNAEGLPPDVKKFRDPATEFDLVRITDPSYSSYLPPAHLRQVSQRNNSLLFTSDRNGSKQPYRIDVKSGDVRQIATTANLDAKTLSFLPDERAACFFDGSSLCQAGISNQRMRTIYEVPSDWERASGFGLTEDGQQSVFVERQGQVSRIRLVGMARGAVSTVLESKDPISNVMPRPRRAGILYRQGEDYWLVNFDGQQNRKLKFASGRIGPALWSGDGKTVLYLSYPDDRTKLHQLRECTPDTNEDKLVANTSQFVNFTRNGDSSVFVGVSASKPSPHILLLLRVTRRELTLCEHRASDPSSTVVVFSPNSQRLFYQTDRQGKPAIYMLAVDRFVENTESASAAS